MTRKDCFPARAPTFSCPSRRITHPRQPGPTQAPTPDPPLPAHRRPPAATGEFHYPEGTMRRWTNMEDVELYSRSRNWTVNLLPLQGVDERTRLATTALPATYPIEPRDGKPSVAVENVPEGLTGPGRWMVNTLERKVYLWPRADGEPRDIHVPRLRELVRVEGTVDVNGPTDVPVKGLRFRGLTLTMGDRDVWTDHDAGIQHDWEMLDKPDALIRFRGALRCALEDCRLTPERGSGSAFRSLRPGMPGHGLRGQSSRPGWHLIPRLRAGDQRREPPQPRVELRRSPLRRNPASQSWDHPLSKRLEPRGLQRPPRSAAQSGVHHGSAAGRISAPGRSSPGDEAARSAGGKSPPRRRSGKIPCHTPTAGTIASSTTGRNAASIS